MLSLCWYRNWWKFCIRCHCVSTLLYSDIQDEFAVGLCENFLYHLIGEYYSNIWKKNISIWYIHSNLACRYKTANFAFPSLQSRVYLGSNESRVLRSYNWTGPTISRNMLFKVWKTSAFEVMRDVLRESKDWLQVFFFFKYAALIQNQLQQKPLQNLIKSDLITSSVILKAHQVRCLYSGCSVCLSSLR